MIPKSQYNKKLEFGKVKEPLKKVLLVDDDGFNYKIANNIEAPYAGVCCTQAEALGAFMKDSYVMAIIDNDANDGPESAKGRTTLRELRRLNQSIPIIYTSMTPNPDWINNPDITSNNAIVMATRKVAKTINEIIKEHVEGMVIDGGKNE